MSNEALLTAAQNEGASPAMMQLFRKLLACSCTSGATGATGALLSYDGAFAALPSEIPAGASVIPGTGADTVLVPPLAFTVPGDAPPGTLLDVSGWMSGAAIGATILAGILRVTINGGTPVDLTHAQASTTAAGETGFAMEGALAVSAGDSVVVSFHVTSSSANVTVNRGSGTDAWLFARYSSLP